MSSDIAGFALLQLWQVTAAVVVVGLLDQLLRERAPRAIACLWCAVLVKSLTPPVFSGAWGIFSLAQSSPAAAPLSAPSAGEFSVVLTLSIGAVWVAGAALVASAAALNHYRLCRWLDQHRLDENDPISEQVRGAAQEVGLRRAPIVSITPDRLGPAVCGYATTRFVVPRSAIEDASVSRALTMHELVHLRRGDHWLALVETAARAIWWFHPGVWWACRRLDEAVERAVDCDVLDRTPTLQRGYALALANVAEMAGPSQRITGAIGVASGRVTISRLRAILRRRDPSTPRSARYARLALLVGATALLLPSLPTRAFHPAPCPVLQHAGVEADPGSLTRSDGAGGRS